MSRAVPNHSERDQQTTAGHPRRVVGGRFGLVCPLAETQGTETFLGADLETENPVVIKTIPVASLSPGALMRLEHESARLQRVPGDWFARLLDTGRDEADFYLVMQYVSGVTLEERLRTGPLSIAETLTVGRALFSALRDLHQQGVLHRGVRPSNVIVRGDGLVRHATLVDFGPVRSIEPEASLRGQRVEAARYVSPEQAGSIDQDVAEPSDLYAAGIVLYHCLAGRPPFLGDQLGVILFEHMTCTPPALHSLGVAVPRALDELIGRLLRKDPRDRYQSAAAVLADLESIATGLSQGQADPTVVLGVHDQRCTLTEPAFVGRDEELQALDTQIRRVREGQAGLILLEGESGGGKTRLLAEMAQRAARDGLWVLRGIGTSEVAQYPFQVLDGIVEGFLAAAAADPALAPRVRQQLGLYADGVSAALPGLAAILQGDSDSSLGPEDAGEARTIQALASFLNALGTPDRPALLILDDCQWADELTCRLVRRWQAALEEEGQPERHVLVIAAFRSEEVPPDHVLRRVNAAAHLRLAPFASAQVRQLAESMAGPLPAEAMEVVIRLAEGSPYMAAAVLRGLVESGALVAAANGWRVEPLALADVGSSRHAASFLARRLALLPEETLDFLSIGAVLGKQFDLDMAAHLGRQTPEQAIAALDQARQRRLVWLRPDGARCVFVHDKVRAALLDRMPSAQRQELHRLAAAFLQERSPESVSELAYHFDAAGDGAAALPYALRAAEQARAQHALEIAEQQYRIAERGARAMDNATRYRIATGLGDVLLLRGRYDAAGELFQAAGLLAEGALAKAQVRGKLGELAFKRGDMDTAVEDFQDALRLLGNHVPRHRLTTLLLLIWEVAMQALHTYFPAIFVHRRRRLPDESERLSIRLFSYLAHGGWYCRSAILPMWAHLRGLNLAERFPPTLELAQAYSEHAPGMSVLPLFDRAIRYAEKSLTMRRELGDLWGQGASLVFYGVTLYAAARYTECIDKCREAIRLLERLGDYWQVHMARYQIAASLYHLGDLAGAIHEARLNHRSGTECGDEQASGIILDVWARAAGGLPESILRSEFERSRHDVQGIAQVFLAKGVCLLGAGDAAGAARLFEDAIHRTVAAGVRNAYTLPNLTWLATAYRMQAEQAQHLTPIRRQALLGKAEAAARRAIRSARFCQNDLAQALREYALILAMRGSRRSWWLFERSLEVARRQQQRYQYTETLLARKRVGQEFGWPEDQESDPPFASFAGDATGSDRDNGPIVLQRETASLSLADRFDTLIDSGRKIASAATQAGVYQEARAAALRLLRGERCLVLHAGAEGDAASFTLAPGEPVASFSQDLLGRSLAARRAVACAEELDDSAAPGQRSALCVPMYVRGRVVACLYVTHGRVRGLFGADEERLADFIATIAGATLENAESFEELHRLNETLEGRVAERTAAAEARAQELATSNRELARVAHELRQTEEQLRVAIGEAEAANRAKSMFLATMSHEIRTPMNGILGMTELASRTALTAEQQGYLNIVKQSGEALLAILNDILDFSKIEAGRMELERVAFDVRDVTLEAAQVFAMPAAQKGLELTCRIAPDVPQHVVGDPGRLRQILINLVGNAIKFTASGEVSVEVSVDTAAARLRFAVTDTGIGVPADKQRTIFEAFRQSDSSTTRRFGGTGLGLSISSQLVALMGGQIGIESQPGQGSTFYFHLPSMLPDEPPPRPALPEVLRAVPVLFYSRQRRARALYTELLESWGLAPVAVENSLAALGAVQSAAKAGKPFRLVIVDMGVTGNDRWALVEALQRRGLPNADCQLVVLLTPTRPDDTQRCQQLALRHTLVKPPKHAEFQDTLAAALGDPAVARSAPADAGPARPLRILLAEDSPVNQEVAVGLLKLRGHQVEVANNGREALERLAHQAFDVVLMDVEMPEMDGLQATVRLREVEHGQARSTPVVAMTAHAMKGFQEQCAAAGMNAYISKPVKAHELFQTVEAVADALPVATALGHERGVVLRGVDAEGILADHAHQD